MGLGYSAFQPLSNNSVHSSLSWQMDADSLAEVHNKDVSDVSESTYSTSISQDSTESHKGDLAMDAVMAVASQVIAWVWRLSSNWRLSIGMKEKTKEWMKVFFYVDSSLKRLN